ncbi:MAG: DUF134 domain-containing protein [FCB group bacterium]|nr:DUF134 domain-containing protein [FCB group bacterium]
MVRPKCQRRVSDFPSCSYFKPQGKPMGKLKEIILTIDELEAIRLADLEGLYQESAAQQMEISRQTFGRILISAHHKIAEALIDGKAIKIEGGEFQMADARKFECFDCGHNWEAPFGTGRPQE